MAKYKNYLVLLFLAFSILLVFQLELFTSQLNLNYFWTYQKQFYKIERYGSLKNSDVTVVSLYYKLNKSKHSHTAYLEWQKNFLQSVSSPLVIFTDKYSIEELLKERKYPTTLYITDSIWTVLDQIGQERNRDYVKNYQNVQHGLDREKHLHNPNLYALWNLKSYITHKIAKDNVYKSSMFIYTDAGAWRQGKIQNWPDQEFALKIKKQLDDKMLFGQLKNEENALKNKNYPDIDLIEGTFFAGSEKALSNFKSEFWNMHDTLLDKGKFIGKDQVLMNLYAFNNPLNSVKLTLWKRNCSTYTNEWFFYQYYFAKRDVYTCFGSKESLLSNFV